MYLKLFLEVLEFASSEFIIERFVNNPQFVIKQNFSENVTEFYMDHQQKENSCDVCRN